MQYYVKYSYNNWNNKKIESSGFFITSSEIKTEDVIDWAKHNIIGASYDIKVISISDPIAI